MKKAVLIWSLAILALSGCATVTLKPVDFSWSFESVLTADAAGYVKAEPKTIAFNAGELFRAETKDAGRGGGQDGQDHPGHRGVLFRHLPRLQARLHLHRDERRS